MLGTATTDHATANAADLVTDDRVLTAYQITIEHSFETAHRLPHLGGKCTSLHGHSWRVAVPVIAPSLSDDATVVEFGALKAGVRQWIDTYLDHGTMLGVDDPLVAPSSRQDARYSASATPRPLRTPKGSPPTCRGRRPVRATSSRPSATPPGWRS
jgi:6-pyruvoyl tetrahydropterin synthase/QueD family protein